MTAEYTFSVGGLVFAAITASYFLMGEPWPFVVLWAIIVSIIAFFSALICTFRGMHVGSLIGSVVVFFAVIFLMGLSGIGKYQVLRHEGRMLVDGGEITVEGFLHVMTEAAIPTIIFVLASVLMRLIFRPRHLRARVTSSSTANR